MSAPKPMSYPELLTVRETCDAVLRGEHRLPYTAEDVSQLLDHIDAIATFSDTVQDAAQLADDEAWRLRHGTTEPDHWTVGELLGSRMLLEELLPLMVWTGGRAVPLGPPRRPKSPHLRRRDLLGQVHYWQGLWYRAHVDGLRLQERRRRLGDCINRRMGELALTRALLRASLAQLDELECIGIEGPSCVVPLRVDVRSYLDGTPEGAVLRRGGVAQHTTRAAVDREGATGAGGPAVHASSSTPGATTPCPTCDIDNGGTDIELLIETLEVASNYSRAALQTARAANKPRLPGGPSDIAIHEIDLERQQRCLAWARGRLQRITPINALDLPDPTNAEIERLRKALTRIIQSANESLVHTLAEEILETIECIAQRALDGDDRA